MNQRATISVNSLVKALPFGAPDDLLLLSIFGSQVKGTERPDSDLDVLYVTRASLSVNTIHDTITKTPGGISKTTVIPHGPDTIAWTANVYGTVEYGVLREQGAKTLWRSADFDIDLHAEIDYYYSAGRWLDMARKLLFPKEGGLWSRTDCFLAHVAACSLLRAILLSARMTFPFTRDIRVLYGMLPPDRRPPLDVDAVDAVRVRYDKDSDEKNWSKADVFAARDLVKPAYNFTRRMVKPIGRSEGRPTPTPHA